MHNLIHQQTSSWGETESKQILQMLCKQDSCQEKSNMCTNYKTATFHKPTKGFFRRNESTGKLELESQRLQVFYVFIFRRNESTGKLGVRITETPSGIYVEGLEDTSNICSQDTLKVNKMLTFFFLSFSLYQYTK